MTVLSKLKDKISEIQKCSQETPHQFITKGSKKYKNNRELAKFRVSLSTNLSKNQFSTK